MLQVAIKDLDKTPMWSLPGTKLFLSFEEPGPIDVDINQLTLDQKKILAQEISRGALVAKGVDDLHNALSGANANDPVYKGGKGTLAKSYSKIRVVRDEEEGYVVKMTTKEQSVAPVEVISIDPLEERKGVLIQFLNKHVATVKKELPGRSLTELRMLREIESQDKKRGSVIKLIDALISKAQAEVFNSIQRSYDPNAKLPAIKDPELSNAYLDNVSSIVDSDYTDVTIKLGADDND